MSQAITTHQDPADLGPVSAGAFAGKQRFRAIQCLGLLMLTCLFSFLDRQILTLLVTPIKASLNLSDSQIGLLQGFSFAIFFCIMALPFGWLTDRYNRRNILFVGILLWSAATTYSGFARSFTDLMLARIAVGVGEASLMPVAYSLLADYFPVHQRGRAFSLFTMSVFVGGGIALVIGGAILHAFAGAATVTMPLIGSVAIWQAAFLSVGTPGFLVALLLLTLKEPPRSGLAIDQARRPDLAARSIWDQVRAHPMAFANVGLAYTLLAYVNFGFAPWAPSFFTRSFGTSLATAGFIVGTSHLVFGCAGAITSGWLADRWTATGALGGKYRLALFFWLAAPPSIVLMAFAPSQMIAVIGICGYMLFNAIGYTSAAPVIQDMVPPQLRGQATSFWYLVTSVIGNGFGPLATALVTEHLFHSEGALRYAILVMALPALLIGAVLNLVGLTAFDRCRSEIADNF